MAVLLFAALPGWAGDIYRSVDAQGVVSFSDVNTPEAVPVMLDTPQPGNAAQTAEQQQKIIDQQLQVAAALEASRLAREAARLRRIEVLASAQPRAVVVPESETRYVGGYGYSQRAWRPGYQPGYPGYPGRPGHPGRPDHPGRPGHPGQPVHPVEPATPEGGGHNPSSYRMRFPAGG